MTNLQKFKIENASFTYQDYVDANCNEITFYNQGTSMLFVNNLPLVPNQQISINGNVNELDTTRYSIRFSGAGVNSCWVIRKIYV